MSTLRPKSPLARGRPGARKSRPVVGVGAAAASSSLLLPLVTILSPVVFLADFGPSSIVVAAALRTPPSPRSSFPSALRRSLPLAFPPSAPSATDRRLCSRAIVATFASRSGTGLPLASSPSSSSSTVPRSGRRTAGKGEEESEVVDDAEGVVDRGPSTTAPSSRRTPKSPFSSAPTSSSRVRRHPYRYDAPTDPKRYDQVLSNIESSERRLYANSCTPNDLSNFVGRCFDVMGPYAKLGRGERCEAVLKYVLSHLPKGEDGKEDVLAMRAKTEGYRIGLHGWCNSVTRLATVGGDGSGAAKSRRRVGPTGRTTSSFGASSSSAPSDRPDDASTTRRRVAMRSAARSAESCLRALLDLSSRSSSSGGSDLDASPASSSTSTSVTAKDYRPVIRAYARCDDVHNAIRVLRLLESSYERSGYDERFAPGVALYTTVIHAVGNAPSSPRRRRRGRGRGEDDAGPETAEVLLDRLERLYALEGGNVRSMTPDAAIYNAVLDAWSKVGTTTTTTTRGGEGGGPRVRRRRSFGGGGDAGSGEKSDAASAGGAGSAATTRRAAGRARAVFDRMAGKAAAAEKDDGGGSDAEARTEDIDDAIPLPSPNARSHALLIYSYCKASMVDDAMDVFEGLVDALLLESATTTGQAKTSKGGKGKDASSFLAEDVDARCFKVLLGALAERHREAVAASPSSDGNGLNDDEDSDDSDNRVPATTTSTNRYPLLMNRVLSRTLDLHRRAGYDEDVAPDVRSYATTINAWADSRSPEGSNEALRLLNELERLYDETKFNRFKPDVAVYNAVADAVAKGGGDDEDPAERAGSVVKRMERLALSGENVDARPDAVTYNVLVDACLASFDSSSSSSSSQDGRDEVVGTKNKRQKEERGIDRAEQTLRWMIGQYESSGDARIKPNARSFSSVIIARAKSRIPGSTAKAEALLDKMEEYHEPDGTLYGIVVEAWANDVLLSPPPAASAKPTTTTSSDAASPTEKGAVDDDDDDADDDVDVVVGPRAARRAHDLLLRAEELYAETRKKKHVLPTSVYLSVTDAWRTSGASDAEDRIERVRALRDRMYPPRASVVSAEGGYDDDDDGDDGEASSPSVTFASDREVFDVLKDVGGGEFGDRDDDGAGGGKRTSFVGNARNFNHIVRALAKSNKPWAAVRAEDVLNYMLQQFVANNRTELKPDVVTFNSVVDAHARRAGRRSGSAARAEAVLNELDELRSDGVLTDVEADVVTYNSVLNAYANSREEGSAEDAERILRSMEEGGEDRREEEEDRGDDGPTGKEEEASTSNSASAEAGEEGEENETDGRRRREEEERESRRRRRPKPDVVSYATAIRAYRGSRGGAQRAESILKRMHERHRSDKTFPAPDARCFNEVLNAWAESGDLESGDRAEMLLRLMEAMVTNGLNDDVKPDVRTYNAVLHAHANAGGGGSRRSAERAQRLLDSMEAGTSKVRPDMVSYNTVLSAWSKCGGRAASLAAERTLRRTFRRLEEGAGEAEGGGKPLRPDAYFFSTVINAFSKSGEKGSARRAEGVLEELEAMNERGLVDFEPDVTVYNALLNCWAKSGEWGAAQRAEEILRFMERKFEEDGDVELRPNARSYTSVLDALARSRERGAARRAEEVLDRMATAAARTRESGGRRRGRRGGPRPTVHAYTAVINAWARSRERGKATRARSVFRRMEEDHRKGNAKAKPNVVAYNAVLNACEYTRRGRDDGGEEEAEEAFKVACLTFDELRTSSDLRPNHVTYGSFLGVVSGLMPGGDMRNDVIEAVFRRCCGEGQVGDVVMKKLGEAAPPELYDELLGGVDEEDLPAKWTRRVVER